MTCSKAENFINGQSFTPTSMKTITKVYNVYTIDELSEEAREKAHQKWIEHNDYYFLSDDLNERLHELLKENNIKDLNDTSNPGTSPTRPTRVMYSLSYCQGDGCMFEGRFIFTFNRKKYLVVVKHSGRYYHYNGKDIEVYSEGGDEVKSDKTYTVVKEKFNNVYVKICTQLEQYGYEHIEYEDSMEAFTEACEANGYTFTSEGVMDNN